MMQATSQTPVRDDVSVELNLLAAQATEASARGFTSPAAKQRFYRALADHLNELATRLLAVN